MSWQIPQGVEVLVSKASVDPDFRDLLVARRAEAAEAIGLALEPAEAMMLDAVPDEQLRMIISSATVPQEHRRAFLGQAAAAMLAALGAMSAPQAVAQNPQIPPDHPPADKRPSVEARVIDIIADQLDIPKSRVSQYSDFARSLRAGVSALKQIQVALEAEFAIALPDKTFAKLRTVGAVSDHIQDVLVVQERVVAVVSRVIPPRQGPIAGNSLIAGDLKTTYAERSQLCRELSKEFRIYLSWETFKRFKTIGEVASHFARALKSQAAAEARKQQKAAQQAAGSRGIRPDLPAMGGIRPGRIKKQFPIRGFGGSGGIRPE